ncbi:lipid-A-disaccharide synthase [Prochlorococcus marinus]|uniref:lipid-A-disaccharide synthase n=1 Tax=Prochlorococcus marinus TaxID=1219 RepID=UPI0022B4B793|nr:lipid-A-disaccharide synthase [Prochlorococcus marinus]
MRLLISTGEVSGDLQGSFLVKALLNESKRRSLKLKIMALGGARMKEAGAELISDTASIGAIGLWEALPYVIPTLKAQSVVDDLFVREPPDALVLIDYMGPNIRLGKKVRKKFPSIPIIYYIAPQEWAWRLGDGGSTDLIGFTNKILAIFQKEADFYSKRGGKVTWVGHPMLDNLKASVDRREACQNLGVDPSRKFLLLFPASRTQELKYLLPILLKAAELIQASYPSFYVLLPAAQESFEQLLIDGLENSAVEGKVLPSKKTDSLKPSFFEVADLAIAKSGTINMELSLHFVPQIVGYKVSRVTAFIAKKLLRFDVDFISPVNLLLNKMLVPELIQKEFTPKAIFELAKSLIDDDRKKLKMFEGYEQLRKNLGEPGVTERAAAEILNLIKK